MPHMPYHVHPDPLVDRMLHRGCDNHLLGRGDVYLPHWMGPHKNKIVRYSIVQEPYIVQPAIISSSTKEALSGEGIVLIRAPKQFSMGVAQATTAKWVYRDRVLHTIRVPK